MTHAFAHRRRQDSRQRILDAAREVFAREGYDGFSMRKLATRIDCSPGTLYLHFKNREELFGHLVDASFAHLHQRLAKDVDEAAPGTDPVTVLRRGLQTYVAFGLSHPDDYRIAFLIRPPPVKRPYTVHAAFDVLRDTVALCIRHKRLRTADAETTSQALWACVHGVTSLLIQRPEFPWVETTALVDQVIDAALDGLVVDDA